MSNRETEAKTLLQISHERQIEALLNEDIDAWVEAASLGGIRVSLWTPEKTKADARAAVGKSRSPAAAAWEYTHIPYSLFAPMPGCDCPVWEKAYGRLENEPLIPDFRIAPRDWRPDRATLEAFARIQQAHRS